MSKKKHKEKGFSFDKEKPPFRTIKISLKSIVKDKNLLFEINNSVIRCNDLISDAYLFIRLYALYKFKKGESVSINRKFIRYCFNAISVESGRGRTQKNQDLSAELKDFYLKEFQPIFNHKKHDKKHLTQALLYAAVTMETCINVNIREHYFKRLYRFVNICAGNFYDKEYGEDNEKKSSIRKLKDAIFNLDRDKVPKKFISWYDTFMPFIVPKNLKNPLALELKIDPHKFLNPMFHMNLISEEYNEGVIETILKARKLDHPEEELKKYYKFLIKLFQPLPLRHSSIPKYIRLDSAALVTLFIKKDKAKMLSAISDYEKEIWDTLFKMNKKVFRGTKDYEFHYLIETDGVGCSLLFHRKGSEIKKDQGIAEDPNDIMHLENLSEEEREILLEKKIVCGDPGKKYLMYFVDEEGKKLKYSCMQRDSESLAKKCRKVRKKIKDEFVVKCETELSRFCSKTSRYEKFKDFIRAKHECDEKVKEHYQNIIYRKLNWRVKTNRQRSEDKFLNRIEEKFGKDIILYLGDWSNKGKIRGLPSTMGLGLKRLISKRFSVLLLDEYNTSKKCSVCHKDLEYAVLNGKKIHRLLVCHDCGCGFENVSRSETEQNLTLRRRRFVTRDKNSCENMIRIVKSILEGKGRPEAFKRGIYDFHLHQEDKGNQTIVNI